MYKVPKERALVLIKTPPGPPEWKTIFISPCAESHRGLETISDLFNTGRDFLPLLSEREGVTLVRRDAIRWVKIEEAERFEWYYYEIRQGAPVSTVRCSFDDGEVLEGALYSISPEGEQRVLDLLNRESTYIHLETNVGLFLVNLKHLTTVSIREGDHGSAR